MVKRSQTLDAELQGAADGPYEAQPIAQRAKGSRKRLMGILLLGFAALAIEAIFARGGFSLVAALYVAGCAFLLHRHKLGGVIATALAALLAVAVPLGMLKMGMPDASGIFRTVVSVGLGLAALPDLLTLVRDAELQYAYGRWARRDG